jgi:hypothetical protein
VNTPPVITSLTTNAAARMEVDQDVDVVATVTDADASVDKFSYTWTATAGVFTGSGRHVAWRLPKSTAATPVNVTITLSVDEAYQEVDAAGQIVTKHHVVTKSADPFRVHDSRAELTKMSVTFLVDYFGNSAISPDACLVDFSDSCPGKADELHDIQDNRKNFVMISATARVDTITFNAAMTSAEVWATCTFTSKDKSTNAVGTVGGDCYLTGVYEQQRWWLCDSHFFNGHVISGAIKDFIKRMFGSGGERRPRG